MEQIDEGTEKINVQYAIKKLLARVRTRVMWYFTCSGARQQIPLPYVITVLALAVTYLQEGAFKA